MHAAPRRTGALNQWAGALWLLLSALVLAGCLPGAVVGVLLDVSDEDGSVEEPRSSYSPLLRETRFIPATTGHDSPAVRPQTPPVRLHSAHHYARGQLHNVTIHNYHGREKDNGGHGEKSEKGGGGGGHQSEYISLLVALSPALVVSPAVALFVFYIIFNDEDLGKEIDERSGQLEDLGNTCDHLTDQVRSQIEDLVEKQVDWSQHDFNSKKEDFLGYLEFLQEHVDRLGGAVADEELGNLNRELCMLWLDTFQECSKNPVTEPFHPIPRQELEECPRSVTGACAWLAERLYEKDVQFVELSAEQSADRRGSAFMVHQVQVPTIAKARTALLNRASMMTQQVNALPGWINVCDLNENYSYEAKKGSSAFPCELSVCVGKVKIHFVSPMHCAVVAYWLVLLPICYHVYTIPHVIGAILILLGWAMVSVLLLRFEKLDMVAQLKSAEGALRHEQDDVRRMKDDLETFYKNVDEISRVWTTRTRPRLDILKQLMRKIMETRWANANACKDFLEVALDGFKAMEKGISGMEYYCYLPSMAHKKVLGRSAMALIQKQLEKVSGIIRLNDAKELTRKLKDVMLIPNLLAVKILAGHKLPKGTWTDNYDPYVRLRAKKEGEWVRTDAVPNCQSPRWHTMGQTTEFRFLVEGYGKELECEVMDQNSLSEDTFMGQLVVNVDTLPAGCWNRVCKELQEPVDPSTPGYLEIEVFLAREAGDLLTLMGDDGPDPDDADTGSDDSSDSSFG